MIRQRATIAVAASVAAVLMLASCASDAATAEAEDTTGPLTFAMPPGTDDPDTLLQVDSVAAMIEEATGREVEVENPADYMAVVEAVRSGFVDVALMSQFSTALAVENGAVSPILVWESEKRPAAVCLVRADSEIQTIDDFAGHSIAFVDPGSTTGHFMPKSMLTQNGLIDGKDYESTFAGSHDSAILAMVNGSVDMACTASQLYPVFLEGGLFAEDQVRQLAETDPIPIGISLVVRTDMDDATRQQLIDGLPDKLMADEGTLDLFGGSREYIANPDADVYAPLLQVAKDVGVSLEDMR
ncbi:phosphate/phosphite/phosphonate ABC transporter substrate-binding protein [Salinibacterium sp. ZJ454]|uniref:phosphate/phosphite/phosphonate ABC transporter substrate-binding protein n=1 Tax=Salinibacterium sp. ZJ454 TaxID=2708339 RepID=UPI0014213B6C|nr:phosphate/phosphite/phosphonate ABC transporter substrate-binding protein [Salinibacterium sp. ZJ454]